MQIVNKPTAELKPYDKNAKRHDKKQIANVAESIKQFGFVQPCVLDKDNNVIIGHCRLEAAKKLHLDEVPCVMADDLTDEQVKKLRLLDNKLNESDWDIDLIAEEIADIDFDGFDVDWELPEDEEAEIIEDEAPEVDEEAEPITKLGDIWQLGRHRLMCGDSTDKQCVEALMGGQKADLFITDPPYNVNYEGKTKDKLKIQNDKMSNDNFRQFLVDAFQCADDVMKAGAVFYIWHADSEGYNFRGACYDIGWKVRECLIWNKNQMVMGRQDYQWKHEPCLYGWKEGTHLWASDRKQTTVLNFDKPHRNGEHPTMKPVALFDYQIRNNTKSEDIVLDLFGGSGTTLIACEQNGRVGYCMELDPRYCDVIVKRWENLTGQKAVLINGKL